MSKALSLSLRLQPKQTELYDLCENSVASWLGYGGSRGGGKSGALRRLMLLRRLKYPGTVGVIFRRVYDDLKKNHIDKFFEEWPELYPFYHVSDHEIILPAEKGKAPSRILFMYAETETEIKRKFHGPEFMDMFIDQAEQLSETELVQMKTCNRWPGTRMHQCKFVLFFNPGGIGLAFFKRIFKEKKYKGKEKESDYAFIQAYGWDNVEWVRSALIEDGLTEDDFYEWDSDKRFEYFIEKSDYGKSLDALPQAMRIGHLLGSLDSFAGQYFDLWNPDQHTRTPREIRIEPWMPKWISIDWGFKHDSAVYWWAQDGNTTYTYREFVQAGLGPRALAQTIIDLSTNAETQETESIDAIYISPDTKAKRTTEDPIYRQMGNVLRSAGLPFPRIADDDRVSGWRLMYDMLKYNRWKISTVCEKLMANIPLLSYNEEDPSKAEDCIKFDGDDPADSARYGLKSRFGARAVPIPVQVAAKLQKIREAAEEKTDDLAVVHTQVAFQARKVEVEMKKKSAPVRFIRRWRGRNHV